jgi:hypothetical protein
MTALLSGTPGQGAEQAFKNRMTALRMSGQAPLAEDMESKHVANTSDAADRPIAPVDREKLLGHQKLDAGLADLNDTLAKVATYNHYSPEYIKGVEKVQKLQSDLRESTLGTVYKQGEQPLLDSILKMPAGQLTSYQTKAQIQELRKINARDANTLKSSYGIQPQNQETIERYDPKSKRTVIYDAKTKKPLRWK